MSKMTPFLREVAEDLVSRFGDELKHCAIVFNNKRPAAYLQKHLADIYGKPFWSPAFFTIQEFFSRSTTLQIADAYSQFFTLYQVFNDLLKKEGKSALDAAKFYSSGKIMLSDFMQIDYDLVDANKLFHELEDISAINLQFEYLTAEQKAFLQQFWASYHDSKHKEEQQKFMEMWRRMPSLYAQFHERLKQQGLVSTGMLYRLVAEDLADIKGFEEEFAKGKIIFVGFNALSQAEARAFKRWQDEGKALFYFDTDAYFTNDPLQEAGLFLRKNLERVGLENALDNQRSFMRDEQEREVAVYKTEGQSMQAKVLPFILDLKDSSAQELSSTAIVLADENLLIPTLQTIPYDEEQQSPVVNVTMGFPLAASSVYGLIDLWLVIQQRYAREQTDLVNFKEVESFLSHPLSGITENFRNKVTHALIKEQLVEVPSERLVRQKGLSELFFKKVTKAAEAVGQLSQMLQHVLEKQLLAKTLKETELNLFLRTIQELNRLDDTLTEHLKGAPDDNTGFVFSLIGKALSGISVPLEGSPLEGLQVMGLLETRNLNFDRVIVLGLNEGIVPKASSASSFIPDSLRRVYGLPVPENQEAISAYMFYRLIQRAKRMDFVYNSQTDESNTGEPSRFIRQLEYESAFRFSHQHFNTFIEAEQRQAIEIPKDEQVMAVLNQYLNGTKVLSASALTTYISNPIDFFYKYIAKVEEPEEMAETVEANKIGSALHLVMEKFYGSLLRESPLITAERIAAKRSDLPQLIEQCFAEVLFDNPGYQLQHSGMQKVVLAIIAAYVDIILEHDSEQSPFSIIAMEQKQKVTYSFLDAKGMQQQISLFGIIDRVDEKGGAIRIVDYKTGADDLKYKSVPDTFDTHGRNLNKALVQTLFYTYVYEKASGILDVEPHLYVLRTMRKDGVLFKCGKEELKGQKLAEEKEAFQAALSDKLAELFNPDVPFYSSDNPNNYRFSKYTELM